MKTYLREVARAGSEAVHALGRSQPSSQGQGYSSSRLEVYIKNSGLIWGVDDETPVFLAVKRYFKETHLGEVHLI